MDHFTPTRMSVVSLGGYEVVVGFIEVSKECGEFGFGYFDCVVMASCSIYTENVITKWTIL